MVKKKTDLEFKSQVFAQVENKYTFLEPYNGSSTPIKVLHASCGNIYKVRPNDFLSKKRRCPYCYGNESLRKSTEEFKLEVFNLVKDEYTVLGKYQTRDTNILIRHESCGREYYVEPGNFLQGSRCIQCYWNSLRNSSQKVISNIHAVLGEEYILLSDYKSSQKPMRLKHLTCGTEFTVRYTDIMSHHSGCPYCKQSKGELFIGRYLQLKGIKYELHKSFSTLRDKKRLSYDFYLPDFNTVIEYQGIQHYEPKTFGGISNKQAKVNFKLQQKHDQMKSKFAKDNNLVLLTPSYSLDNFQDIYTYLNNNLKK